jgi:dihydroorotate dehydrogenase (fumarate)
MDLSTRYLGLELSHPLMPGASPMVDDLDTVKRLEDAGASAIVMHSLFEEQIQREQVSAFVHTVSHEQSFAEALSYFPSSDAFALGPHEYLEQLRKIKAAVSVPVIASLNGYTLGGWLDYARLMQEAGADALELNVYQLATDPDESGDSIEARTIEMVRAVRGAVKVPLAVKLSPFYTALGHFTRRLDQAGVDGLVLFNRFYQPDIDIEELQVRRAVYLSHSSELPLRLRWLAILSGKVKASLAVSGGVHTVVDVIQSVMTGAHAVQIVSALL